MPLITPTTQIVVNDVVQKVIARCLVLAVQDAKSNPLYRIMGADEHIVDSWCILAALTVNADIIMAEIEKADICSPELMAQNRHAIENALKVGAELLAKTPDIWKFEKAE